MEANQMPIETSSPWIIHKNKYILPVNHNRVSYPKEVDILQPLQTKINFEIGMSGRMGQFRWNRDKPNDQLGSCGDCANCQRSIGRDPRSECSRSHRQTLGRMPTGSSFRPTCHASLPPSCDEIYPITDFRIFLLRFCCHFFAGDDPVVQNLWFYHRSFTDNLM